MTIRTNSLATIPTHHHAILYLVLILLDHLEKGINVNLVVNVQMFFGRKTMPKHILLLARQFEIRFENGKPINDGFSAKHLAPNAHLVTMPTLNATIIHAQRTIGDDQFLINSDNASKAFARRTSANGRVEGEHIIVGFFKRHAVCFIS